MAETNIAPAPEMVEEIPKADPNRLTRDGDGTALFSTYRYTHHLHAMTDLLRPGYFDTAGGYLHRADEISITVGGPAPEDPCRDD